MFFFAIILSLVYSNNHHRCPEFDLRLDRPELSEKYLSPSGNFFIHYDIDGINAPSSIDSDGNDIPDYVESAAVAADSVKYILNSIMGYIDVPGDADSVYDIYILNLSSSLYGSCHSEGSGTSYIRIRNSYDSLLSGYCSNATDMLWMLIAHEYFHAVQYAYRSHNNDSYFRELTATWFENVFSPNCYDFLQLVDNGPSALFNNPELEFGANTTASIGYSMGLYGHYLSTVTDKKGIVSQLSSTIIKEVWEKYALGGTVFNSLKDVISNDEYNTSFALTWLDFMSRNLMCGLFPDMSNGIYYNLGQSLIDPPNIDFFDLNTNSIINLNVQSTENSVSILAFTAADNLILESSFNSNGQWYGNSIYNSDIYLLSHNDNLDSSLSLDNNDELFYIFTNTSGSVDIDLSMNVSIYGCMDEDAVNYNSNALFDGGDCEYPNRNKLVSLYPNPINSNINSIKIIYDKVDESFLSIKIYDLKGSILKYKRTFVPSGRNLIHIDSLGDIASGVYFVKILDGQNISYAKFLNLK